MPTLVYTISTMGEDRLKRVLRSTEAEAKASARRMDATTRSREQKARGQSSGSSSTLQREHMQMRRFADRAAREQDRIHMRLQTQKAQRERAAHNQSLNGFAEIGRVARAEEFRIHKEKILNERKQRSNSLRGFAEIGKAARAEEYRRARARIRTAENFGRGGARLLGGSVARTGRTLMGVGGLVAGAVGIGAIAAGKNAVDEEIDIRAKASQLANQAGTPEIKGKLAEESRQVQGFTGTETLGAMEQFVNLTGSLEKARQIIPDLGRLSLATGANIEDLAATAGQAFNVIKDSVSDPKQQITELNSLMAVLAQQGALGSVEIKDLAQDFGKLGAATRGFEGGAPELLRTVGAFAQLAVRRGGAENSADASTAAARLASDIVVNKKKFKALGVDVKSKSDPTKLRNPMEIIADVLQKTGGDIEKTSGLFGLESAKIFKGLAPVYADAEKNNKGSGRAAVMSEFNSFAKATAKTPEQLRALEQSRLADPDLQFKEAMKEFNRAIAAEFMPTVTAAIPKFKEIIPALAMLTQKTVELAAWFAENPFKGIGAIVLGMIAKDLLMAGIGKGVEGILSGVFARSAAAIAGTGAATTAATAVTGAVGTAGATGAAGVAGAGAAGAAGAGVLGRFMAPTVLGASVGTAGMLGAGALAAGGVAAAYLQNERLKKVSGGMGAGDLLSGMWDKRTFNPFEVIDANQNKQAKEAAQQRDADAVFGGNKTAQLDTAGFNTAMVASAEQVGSIIASKIQEVSTTSPRRTNSLASR